VGIDNLTGKAQAQAAAARLPGAGQRAAEKGFEDFAQFFRRNAWPAIRDLDFDRRRVTFLVRRGANANPASASRVPSRIADEILKDPAQGGGISTDRR